MLRRALIQNGATTGVSAWSKLMVLRLRGSMQHSVQHELQHGSRSLAPPLRPWGHPADGDADDEVGWP
jgi:hypothetical protein